MFALADICQCCPLRHAWHLRHGARLQCLLGLRVAGAADVNESLLDGGVRPGLRDPMHLAECAAFVSVIGFDDRRESFFLRLPNMVTCDGRYAC